MNVTGEAEGWALIGQSSRVRHRLPGVPDSGSADDSLNVNLNYYEGQKRESVSRLVVQGTPFVPGINDTLKSAVLCPHWMAVAFCKEEAL